MARRFRRETRGRSPSTGSRDPNPPRRRDDHEDRESRRERRRHSSGNDPREESVDDFITRLIGQHGSTENALKKLASEVRKYRIRAQDAEYERDGLTAEDLLAEGEIILDGDDAVAYTELRKANKDFSLKGLSDVLKEHGELKKESSATKRDKDLTTAAGTTYKKSVLAKLLGDMPLSFKGKLVPDPDKDGETKEIQIPFVKVGDTLETLDAYLEREHKDWMEVLKVKDGDHDTTSSTNNDTSTAPGIRLPRQAPPSNGGPQGEKGKVLAAVDKSLGSHMSPSQFRKQQTGAGK